MKEVEVVSLDFKGSSVQLSSLKNTKKKIRYLLSRGFYNILQHI